MAVNTPLSDATLREHLRLFRIGEIVESHGVTTGRVNTLYDVSTTRGRYVLRVFENRSESDARFEEALLGHLTAQGLAVPRMLVAGRRGCVVPIAPRRQLSVFQYPRGRTIGVFEVSAELARQVGIFLAELHCAARGLGRRRPNRYDPRNLSRILRGCLGAARNAEQVRDASVLADELSAHSWPRQLARGIIHGSLFIDNVRFAGGALTGALDFEGASSGPLVFDLATALVDWAFLHDAFVAEHARALVGGYETHRALKSIERDLLYDMCRYATVRFATTRLRDYDIRPKAGVKRPYKDYRHFLKRLASLRSCGPDGFIDAVFGGAATKPDPTAR